MKNCEPSTKAVLSQYALAEAAAFGYFNQFGLFLNCFSFYHNSSVVRSELGPFIAVSYCKRKSRAALSSLFINSQLKREFNAKDYFHNEKVFVYMFMGEKLKAE